MIMRAEFWVMVSSTWPAKNTIAVSMIANNRAKNTGATRANSTAAEPRRLRRNRRKMLSEASSLKRRATASRNPQERRQSIYREN